MMSTMRYLDYHIATPLLALTLLLASGCRSNVSTSEPAAESTSSTMVTLRTSVIGTMGTRAVSETDADPLAGSGEGEVEVLNLWLAKEGWMEGVPDKTNAPTYQATFKVNGVHKPSEVRDYTILLNGHKLYLNTISRSKLATIGLDQISLLMDPKGFTMTGVVDLKATVKPGITVPETPDKNVFPTDGALEVERVVSKAQLYKKSGFTATGLPGTIASNSLHWSVAGSGKKVYLYRNQAGDRTMGLDGIYDKLTTASDESDLMKLSDVIKAVDATGNFAWKELSATASGKKSVEGGIYFYEHALTETKGQANPYPRTVGYDKVAYAKVYGDLGKISKGKKIKDSATPTEGAYTPADLTATTAGDFTGERKYDVTITKEWYDKMKATLGGQLTETNGVYTLHMVDKPGTFYVGANGVIYNTLLAAMADGNKSARKYTGGRMVYLTPLNAQGEPGKIFNCDTRRNNIYDLAITGITGLGYNYDPVDHDDPYIPKPNDNPLEPDPEIPSINDTEITIKVKARVLNWNYIHQSYDLLGETK